MDQWKEPIESNGISANQTYSNDKADNITVIPSDIDTSDMINITWKQKWKITPSANWALDWKWQHWSE